MNARMEGSFDYIFLVHFIAVFVKYIYVYTQLVLICSNFFLTMIGFQGHHREYLPWLVCFLPGIFFSRVKVY